MIIKSLVPSNKERGNFERVFNLLSEAYVSKDLELFACILHDQGRFLGYSKKRFLKFWERALEFDYEKEDVFLSLKLEFSACACCSGHFNLCFDNKLFPQHDSMMDDEPRGLAFKLKGNKIIQIQLCKNPLDQKRIETLALEN